MKIFKHKNFMGLIYSLLVALPFLSILVSSAYVVLNKNAYISYDGNQLVYERVSLYDTDGSTIYAGDMEKYQLYYADSLIVNTEVIDNYLSMYIYKFSYMNFLDLDYSGVLDEVYRDDYEYDIYNYLSITFSNHDAYVYYTNENCYAAVDYSLVGISFTNVYFVINGYDQVVLNEVFGDITVISPTDFNVYEYRAISDYAPLNNAFDYAIDKTIKDNNYGNIDFLSWFSNMFLNMNNNINARYVRFANWYMNYVMFVSCAYLLFLVLMWFINFARRLLDRGMNYDW